MQQQDSRRARHARLAIEDVYPINFGRAITGDGHVRVPCARLRLVRRVRDNRHL